MTDTRAIIGAFLFAAISLSAAAPARALDRPWISDVFFYWYQWEEPQHWGNWANGGVYYTPLAGYYDSRSLATNRREIQTAAEWGMTNHFMDYWSPDWQGEGGAPRDRILMEAAESVRAAGYQAWMGYYQDGDNFEMREFSRNVSEQRDVYNWLKHYAPFGAWPRLNGFPFQLVYGRNGAPEVTLDDPGFREFLHRRYGGLKAVNAAWGADYKSLDDIRMSFGARGTQRADAVDYQYLLWEQEWARLNQLVREEFGYPGIRASFDVGYRPFRDFGFCDFARVFGGPHSYGGVFGPPHEQDVERFIQSIVAKRYDTVFLDHLKGYYCDWNTVGRIPGTQYPPEPFAYDRFWVGDLMRYNEAVLHLSWNEWWEGSNLEPSLELGKDYCEQNLFYSTLMQACFPSLRDFGQGAAVAVLLNDWAFKCGSDHTGEIYAVIQELRRSMVPFDLVVDDQATPEMLRRFDLIFAPAAGVGFGRNARGDAIAPLLLKWLGGGQGRKLVASDCPQLRELLGLQTQPPAATSGPGPDLSVFVDIGEPADEEHLLSGYSGREEWSQLPADSYGKTAQKYTVRWTPADADRLRLRLPVSPNRNHLLRFSGSVMWPSEISVRVGGVEVDRVQLQEGVHDYRAHLPASALGPRHFAEIEFGFAPQIIPAEMDPARFPNERRICNLALDWVQIATANLDFSREQRYQPPSPVVDFTSPIYGSLARQSRRAFSADRDFLLAPGAGVTARYRADGAPRDLVLREGQVLYVNGQMDDAAPGEWIAAVLERWAGARAPIRVYGESVIGAALRAEDTVILLAYNCDPDQARPLDFAVRTNGRPVAQVTALRRDGEAFVPISWRTEGDDLRFGDSLRYFGVYEVVFSPVKVEMGEVVLHPGEQGKIPINLTAGSDPVSGAVALVSAIPSLQMTGEAVRFEARPWETARLDLPVVARTDADWGHKTIGLRVETPRGAAILFRSLEIEPNPEVAPAPAILDGRQPRLTLVNTPPPGAKTCGRAAAVTVEVGGRQVSFGDIPGGGAAMRTLPLAQPFAGRPRLARIPATISYTLGNERVVKECELDLAVVPAQAPGPPDALAAIHVFNASDEPRENCPLLLRLPSSLGALAERLYVRDDEARPLPTQIDFGTELGFIGRVPARSAATFYLMLSRGDAPKPVPPGTMELTVEPRSRLTGTVRLANSRLSAVISAARGGTLASLRSQATGLDYGAESLGLAYGQWSEPVNPASPARQPQQLIAERRVRQAERPAAVELLSSGPVRALVGVTWSDGQVRSRQVYELRAYQPYLHVNSEVTAGPDFAAQELVLLDGRFNARGLTKISPGFSGMTGEFDNDHPHFGWREGGCVPNAATMMQPPGFPESLSLVLMKTGGADHWRQGFWPENRPQPGPCRYAWCEVVSTTGKGGEIDAYALLHAGNQAVAQEFRRELERPPLVVVTQASGDWKRASEPGVRSYPTDWWSPYWRLRAPVRVKMSADLRLPATVSARISPAEALQAAGIPGRLDLESLRVIEVDDRGRSVAALPAAVAPTGDDELSVLWQVLPISPWRGERTYHIYLDTTDGGPHARQFPDMTSLPAVLSDPSLERENRYWVLQGTAQWAYDEAHSGRVAARLESDGEQGLGLLQAPSFPAGSSSEYRVSFWAKAVAGEGLLRVNFFIDAAHDYPQQEVSVPGDGLWHHVEVAAPTGEVPAGALPALRIWAIARKQVTLVDDVTVEMPQAPAVEITVGEAETQ